MFPSDPQFSDELRLVTVVETTTILQVHQNVAPSVAGDEMQNGGLSDVKSIIRDPEKLQDDLKLLGTKIKQHEDTMRLLKAEKNKVDNSILNMQGPFPPSSEEETTEQILRHDKSAAGILCQLKTRHGTQTSHLALTKDVLGVVATLGKVDDENLSRLLSEYLGVQTMLAIVCKTYEGVKALETYNQDGSIDKTSGLQGLGASIGKSLDGRFVVICLESSRPYAGDFVANEPQRKLDLLKPRLPNGECPPGFLGFAVNMIHVDNSNLSYVTASGEGLRETLFYTLFSHLQVYRTRAEMFHALPFITEGAVSLDGGMIGSDGLFFLGSREEVDVIFPKPSAATDLPQNYIETEKQMKAMRWEKEKLEEDMMRELVLLSKLKFDFERKKQGLEFLAQSSSHATHQVTGQRRPQGDGNNEVQLAD